MSDGYAQTKSILFMVNAIGAARAMDLAMDAACDKVFTCQASEWDDQECLPAPQDHDVFEVSDLAGYEVKILRRGYSSSYQGPEYEADYAVADCSGPLPLYAKPDIQDDSPAYRAEVVRVELDVGTIRNDKNKGGMRL